MVTDEWRREGTRKRGRKDQPLLIASHSRIIYTEALTVRAPHPREFAHLKFTSKNVSTKFKISS